MTRSRHFGGPHPLMWLLAIGGPLLLLWRPYVTATQQIQTAASPILTPAWATMALAVLTIGCTGFLFQRYDTWSRARTTFQLRYLPIWLALLIITSGLMYNGVIGFFWGLVLLILESIPK